MKKTFKFKRWMAFALAFLLIATTCISSADAFLSADEGSGSEAAAEALTIETQLMSVGDPEPAPAEAIPESAPASNPETESVPEEAPELDYIPEETAEPTEPTEPVYEETPAEEETTTVSPVQDPAADQEAPGADATPDNEVKYGYSIYFYYDETEGKCITGEGTLGESILQSANVTVEEGTVEYDGQNYIWVETVNKDGVITEDEISNTVKVLYKLSDESDDPEVSEGDDQIKDDEDETDEEEAAYSLSFVNDPVKGGEVKVVSVDGEASGAETAYAEGTQVTFEVSANKGYEVSSVEADGGALKKASDDEEVYTVTVEDDTTVTVAYEEVVGRRLQSASISALNETGETAYTIRFVYAPPGTNEISSSKLLAWGSYPGKVGELVDGSQIAKNYPTLAVGKRTYYSKSSIHGWAGFVIGDDAEKDATNTNLLKLSSDPNKNVIYIYYEIYEDINNIVKITFDPRGGSVVGDYKELEGESQGNVPPFEMPSAIRDGYNFIGWYTEPDGGTKIDTLPEKYPDESVTYYAHWEETVKAGKVIYDGNGASGSVASQEAKIGDTVFIAGGDGLTKEGYSFAGWNVDKEGSGTWLSPGESYKVEQEEITLYAQWKPESVSYTVHYYLKGSSEKVKEDKVELYKNYGDSITESAPSIDGYTVEGSGTATITLGATAANVITFYYTKDANPNLEVTKVVQGKTTGYQPGDKVTYKITVKNTGDVLLTEVTVKDELTGDSKVYKDFRIGNEASFETVYTVKEQDVAFGQVTNKVNASAKIGDKEVAHGSAVATIETVEKKSHLMLYKVATSSPKNGVAYDVGETITYTIKAENDGNQTLKNVIIEDTLTGKGQPITEIKPGEVAYLTTSYVVTEADRKNGEVINIVMANAEGLSPEDVTPGSATVPTVKSEPALSIEKKAIGNTGGREYWLDEKVTYTITVKNTGNVTLDNITVDDDKTGDRWEKVSLKPGEVQEFTTKPYTVTEGDIRSGSVVNKANAVDQTASVSVATEEKILTKSVDSRLTLTKKTVSTPANGDAYTLGEVIRYEIQAKNNGNVTLHNVVVADPLTNEGWTIKEIAPGQSSTVMTTSYTVQESDIAKGTVINEAIVKGVSADDPEPEVENGRTEDKTTEENRLLVIDKKAVSTPANGTAYGLGETVAYEIVAWNKGNQTLKNVVVKDELTDKTWTIAEIRPDQRSETMTTSYVVQEADLRKGEVLNVATAWEQSPPADKPELTVDPGKETVPTDKAGASLSATKKAADSGKQYALGDEVTYTISVVNNGNQTIHDIVITDPLTGESWKIPTLATDGKPENFTTTYTVTEDDIKKGIIENVVTVKGLDPDNNPVETTAEETVRTVPQNPGMSVNKTVTDLQTQYQVGDTIRYQIAVKNTGNVTLHNVTVADQLTGTNGSVVYDKLNGGTLQGNGTVIFAELGVGDERFITCHYVVARSDAGRNIGNTVNVTSDEIPTPQPGTAPSVPTERLYTLTIHYVYENGVPAAGDYRGEYLAGERIDTVYSPLINGYNPDIAFFRSGENGMPGRDIEITVTYRAASVPVPDPTDPTPTPGPTDPTPTPGPTDPTPTPGPTDPTPTPGSTDPTPTPGPTDPTPTPGPTAPVLVATAPTAPAGTAPVVLAAPTAGLAAIPDGEVAGAAIELDDEGDPILTAVSDERVPLTNRELDEHVCCIMSFLLMFATMIIYTWFTHSMKKRQKKLVGLRDQLAEETLRRQLGIMDDQQSIM